MNIKELINAYDTYRQKGWMPGGCGGLAKLYNITETSKKIYITPEKPRSKQITSNDLFLLRNLYGENDIQNPLNQVEGGLVISRWASSFIEIFSQKPSATVAAQFCSKWSVLGTRTALAAWRKNSTNYPNVFRLAHWGLLNELGADHELLLPIINLRNPGEILSDVKNSLKLYPQTCAILIRDYGVLTWGDSLEDLENRMELLEHLMELQIRDFDPTL